MANILTVSVTDEQNKAIKELKLSPSKLLQSAVDRKIEEFNEGLDYNSDTIKEFKKKVDNWKELTYKYKEFLEKRGLLEEFLKLSELIK